MCGFNPLPATDSDERKQFTTLCKPKNKTESLDVPPRSDVRSVAVVTTVREKDLLTAPLDLFL